MFGNYKQSWFTLKDLRLYYGTINKKIIAPRSIKPLISLQFDLDQEPNHFYRAQDPTTTSSLILARLPIELLFYDIQINLRQEEQAANS